MTVKQRLPYFLGGLLIGVIVVVFFFGKKNTSFDYGPNARVLKNIRTKTRMFSNEALLIINAQKIDTSQISKILGNGNVDLRNKIKLDSCLYQYSIKGRKELKNTVLTVKNCDSTVIIKNITFQ